MQLEKITVLLSIMGIRTTLFLGVVLGNTDIADRIAFCKFSFSDVYELTLILRAHGIERANLANPRLDSNLNPSNYERSAAVIDPKIHTGTSAGNEYTPGTGLGQNLNSSYYPGEISLEKPCFSLLTNSIRT